jgi:hypothetical protein
MRECVTPMQLAHVADVINGDMELLEGYEDLDEDLQEKVSRAIEQGHIDDDDWTGDPEFNRPGRRGKFSRSSPKKKQLLEGDSPEATPQSTPKKPKSRTKKTVKEEAVANEGVDDAVDAGEAPTPVAKQPKSRKRNAIKEEEDAPEDEAYDVKPIKGNVVKAEEGPTAQEYRKPKSKRAAKKSIAEPEDGTAGVVEPAIETSNDVGEAVAPKKTRGRPKKVPNTRAATTGVVKTEADEADGDVRVDADVDVPRKRSRRPPPLATAASSRPKRGVKAE